MTTERTDRTIHTTDNNDYDRTEGFYERNMRRDGNKIYIIITTRTDGTERNGRNGTERWEDEGSFGGDGTAASRWWCGCVCGWMNIFAECRVDVGCVSKREGRNGTER